MHLLYYMSLKKDIMLRTIIVLKNTKNEISIERYMMNIL